MVRELFRCKSPFFDGGSLLESKKEVAVRKATNPLPLFLLSGHAEQKPYNTHDERRQPCYDALLRNDEQRPSPAQLPPSGSDRGDAWRVQQAECQHGRGCKRGKW